MAGPPCASTKHGILVTLVRSIFSTDRGIQENYQRPVFSFVRRGTALREVHYLSYDSVEEIAGEKHLAHLSDSVLDEYTEDAE